MHGLLLVLLLAQPSQPPTPTAGPVRGQQQQAGKTPQPSPTPKQDVSPTPQPTPVSNYLVIENANGEPDRDSSPSNLSAIILGTLTIGIGFMQWLVMRRQSAISEEQRRIAAEQNTIITNQSAIMSGQRDAAEKQTGHMEASLAEMRKSAEATKATLNLLEVASVQLTDIELVTGDKDETFLKGRITIRWKNFGRSVARQVAVQSFAGLPHHNASLESLEVPIVLGPNQIATVGFDPIEQILSQDDALAVFSRTQRLLVWAVLSYTDVFGTRTTLDVRAEWIPQTNRFKWTQYRETAESAENQNNRAD